jgi:hypothetical protein
MDEQRAIVLDATMVLREEDDFLDGFLDIRAEGFRVKRNDGL